MTEHPAVAFLLAAHQQAEEQAHAAEAQFPSELWIFPLGPHPAVNAFHAVNTPMTVLRRLAAERKQLAEHAPDGLMDGRDETECRTCSAPSPGLSGMWPVDWPCQTVLLLAQAWGWEAV